MREAGTAGEWEREKIALYVDEASAAPDLRARGVAWCAESWIPGETILVAFAKREPAPERVRSRSAGTATLSRNVQCRAVSTLLEEAERYKRLPLHGRRWMSRS